MIRETRFFQKGSALRPSWVEKIVIVVALLGATSTTMGQNTTGTLQGIVKDPNGAVVSGATVKVTNVETGVSRETTTNDQGFYRATNLIPGDYAVEVSARGFDPKKIERVPVRLGTENNADVGLGIAGATGEVTVTGDSAVLQTTQSQLSQTYETRQLTQLPFNGGLIDNLALLTPGVVTPGDADFSNGVGISANGNRGRSNNFQIDGQDNNDNSVAGPSLFISNTEAIGEYQVITNNYSAEFGRNAGAQINTITKPGTNDFHGALFMYHQNSALNTRDNLDKKTQAQFNFLATNGFGPQFGGLATRDKDPFSNNRFGGSIGGPIKENKAFFFVTYQGDRQRGEFVTDNLTSGQVTFTRESAELARALFPNAATAALTSTAVAGGPAFAQGVGTYIIAPPLLDTDGDGVGDDFSYGGNRLSEGLFVRNGGVLTPLVFTAGVRTLRNDPSTDQVITRMDFNLTDKDVLSGRYIYDNARNPLATGRFLAGAVFDVPSQNNNLGITYTRTISSRFVNEARFNFSRLNVEFGDTSQTPGPGIQFSGTRNLNFDLSLTFGTQNNLPQSRTVDVYQYQDTLSGTLGNHGIKFGADIRQQKVNNFFLPNFLGTYSFAGSTPTLGTPNAASGFIPGPGLFFFANGADRFNSCDSDPATPGLQAGPCRATAYENLLLGRPRQINFALGNPEVNTTQNDYFFFVQDDWRVRPNLTLNLGLRYELSTTPFNPIIEDLNAREADPNRAIFNQAFPLETRTASKLPLDKNNFAPRVGFAWTPNWDALGDRFTNGRTVIRGGFGIAYDPSFFNIVLNTVTATPFAAAGVLLQTPGAAGSVSFPFLPSTTAQLNTTPGTNGGDPRLFNQTRVDPNFYNPYTMQYNFGIQQEIFKNTVLEARYVGSRIVGQFQTVTGNPNVAWLNRGAACLGLNPGTFTNGLVVGAAGANPCSVTEATAGFNNRLGTNGNGRLDPNFGPVRSRINGASATYNGLQMRLDTRVSNDLILNASYTLSKTIDNASEIFSTGGGGQGVADPQRFFDSTNGERGLSAFHQKHNFTANFTYEFPWFQDQRGASGKLLGGWSLSGIVRMGSGRPYTPLQAFGTYDPAFENAFFGVGALRPFHGNPNAGAGTIAFGFAAACLALFGGPECATATPGQFIVYDTLRPGSPGTIVSAGQVTQSARVIYNDFGLVNQAFIGSLASLEAFNLFRTPFGDVGRNTFSGLPFYGVNMALFKTTKLSENTKLEFRVEASNLLNRRNFGVPDAFTEDAHNGFAVSSYQNPGFNNGSQRELRFGLRFIF